MLPDTLAITEITADEASVDELERFFRGLHAMFPDESPYNDSCCHENTRSVYHILKALGYSRKFWGWTSNALASPERVSPVTLRLKMYDATSLHSNDEVLKLLLIAGNKWTGQLDIKSGSFDPQGKIFSGNDVGLMKQAVLSRTGDLGYDKEYAKRFDLMSPLLDELALPELYDMDFADNQELIADAQADLADIARLPVIYPLLMRAGQGDAGAQAQLAQRYMDGDCQEEDRSESRNYELAPVFWSRMAAKQGIPAAQYLFAYLNDDGEEKPRWHKYAEEAEDWYLAAVRQGSADAECALGTLYKMRARYCLGIAIEHGDASPEYTEAIRDWFECRQESLAWYRKAARHGQAEAQADLMKLCLEDPNAPLSHQEQRKWARAAAENGDANAQRWLCKKAEELGDVAELAKWRLALAQHGDTRATLELGKMYERGQGLERDYREALRWYRQIAQSDADAQYALGRMHELGRGVERNGAKAVAWYKVAAANGSTSAMHVLGQMCELGEDVEQSDAEALRWYRKAVESVLSEDGDRWEKSAREFRQLRITAKRGDTESQLRLARACELGLAVAQNFKQALYWYTAAARQGSADAQRILAKWHATGHHVERDYAKAATLYKLAAENGDAECAYAFAKICEKGRGVERDLRLALYWYRKAALRGVDGAQRDVERLAM